MDLICVLGSLYLFVVLARVFMSWIEPTPGTGYAQVYTAVYNVTEPVLGPLRRAIPPVRFGMMAIDLSALIVLIGGRLLLASIC